MDVQRVDPVFQVMVDTKNRANVVDALVVPSALFMTCHRRKPCAEMIPAGERVRCNQQSVVRVRVQRGK
ncbi:hypothetical protein N9B79_00160 [bacterium]|nr:hypothetical protein [bacterium]